MNAKIIGRVRVVFPVAFDFATSIQIVLSSLVVSVFCVIFVPELAEVNPFFVARIKYLELFRRLIRDKYFGSFAQVFVCVFLNESKIGIFHSLCCIQRK
jgi:hypothetical protein